MDELLAAVKAEAERLGLQDALCVVAVSGGPDSVALWHLLERVAPELRVRLHLLHVDHGWRPADADREAAICRGLASASGAGYSIVHLAPPERRSEEAARTARLHALTRIAAGLGARAVALAHHQDDQAETVLMQLLRGSAAAAGMRGWRAPLWRPLLGVPKERLLALCKAEGLAYADDPTNVSDGNLRARLRRDVMPLLRRENPRAAEALARNAALRAEDDAFLEEEARAMLEALPGVPGGVDLRLLRTAAAPVARRALRALLLRHGADASMERIADLLAGLRAGTRMQPARGLALEDGALWWGAARPEAVFVRDGMRARFGELWVGIGDAPPDALSAAIPAEAALVRARRPGDRLRTPGGARKLQDILVDRKVPRRVRDLIPIFIIDGVPFWLPGQPWAPPASPSSAPQSRARTAWAGPAQVVTSLWSVLK